MKFGVKNKLDLGRKVLGNNDMDAGGWKLAFKLKAGGWRLEAKHPSFTTTK